MGYSMGGLVVAGMVQEARRQGWTCFDQAPLVLLASSGVMKRDSPIKLTMRGLHDLYRQTVESKFVVPELDEISTRRIHLAALADCVGHVAVGAFGQDCLQPAKDTDEVMAELFAGIDAPDNVSYFTPYLSVKAEDGLPLGIRGSHHTDPFSLPRRMVESVAPQLKAV